MSKSNIYNSIILNENICIKITDINSSIKKNFEAILKKEKEGKCGSEGYLKPNSIKIISYSTGVLYSDFVKYNVFYECLISNPPENIVIECIVKSTTKVGIRAEINDENSPFIVFISRDHHYERANFSEIKENDIINVRIIGKRFELNDKYISVIGELIDKDSYQTTKKELKKK
jgi:DNA-directed RNA polymerase subunit E'/Rpb7